MESWRAFAKFTDAALDAFIRGFPSHGDHAAALLELERRREEKARSMKTGKLPATVAASQDTGTRSRRRRVTAAGIAFLILITVCVGLVFGRWSDGQTRAAARAQLAPSPTISPAAGIPGEGTGSAIKSKGQN